MMPMNYKLIFLIYVSVSDLTDLNQSITFKNRNLNMKINC